MRSCGQVATPTQIAHWNRGRALYSLGRGKDAIAALTTALRFNPNNYHARFTRGRAYFLTKDYAAAAAAFNRMIRLRPRDYSAYHNRGLAYLNLGFNSRAIASFEKAVSIKPNFAMAYINLGYAIWRRDGRKESEYRRAIEYVSMGLRFDPKNNVGYLRRGQIRARTYLNAKRFRKLFQKLFKTKKPISESARAAAVKDLQRSIQLSPHNSTAFWLLAELALSQNEYARAMVSLDMVVRLSPDYRPAYEKRAGANAALGNHAAAIKDLDRAIKLTQRPSAFGSIGIRIGKSKTGARVNFIFRRGTAQQAGIRIGDIVMAVDGKSVATAKLAEIVRHIRGPIGSTVRLTIRKSNKQRPAVVTVRRIDLAKVYSPFTAVLYRQRAQSYLAVRKYSQAIKDFDAALSLSGQKSFSSAVRLQRGSAYGRRRMFQKAVADYFSIMAPYLADRSPSYRYYRLETDLVKADVEARLAENPEDIQALWVRSATRGKNYRAKIGDYSAIAKIRPDQPGIYKARARAYSLIGECKNALQDFSRALKQSPNDAALRISRASCNRRLGRKEAYIADLRRALELRPRSLNYLLFLVSALRKEKRWDDAIAAMDLARRHRPGKRDLMPAMRASIYGDAGRYQKAIGVLNEVMKPNASGAYFHALRGSYFAKLSKHAEAIGDYTNAIRQQARAKKKPDPNHYSQRGRQYWYLKRFEKAISDLSTAITLRAKPRSSASLYDLYFRADALSRLKRYDPALKDIDTLKAQAPNYPFGLNLRAWILFSMGRSADGLPDIQKALSLKPKNPYFLDTRANIYVALGRTTEAIADFRAALKIKPDLKESRAALNKLLSKRQKGNAKSGQGTSGPKK